MKKLLPVVILAVCVAGLSAAPALARTHRTLVVCKHGCKYRKIQQAVDAARAGETVSIRPGKYVEGVIVRGHRKDGLKIVGASRDPRKVILEGKGAKGPLGVAQNGVEGFRVNNLAVRNLWARNYAGNGVFVHECRGYLFENLVVSHNVAYGLYAFKCIGGRMTHDVGYLHADSAWYVGATPPQKHPVWTQIDHMKAYKNVLGYSGTNSRYVRIHQSEFFNNGAGIVPNTLDSEPYEPATNNLFDHNLVYWNNFDYYKKGSGIPHRDQAVNGSNSNYPIGIGVILFGNTGAVVRDNKIFGNRKWGAGVFGNPTVKKFDPKVAESYRNTFRRNKMGRAMGDLNGTDFFATGDGFGNCYDQPGATFDPSPTRTKAELYPACPNKSKDHPGYDGTQLLELADYASKTTGEEDSWLRPYYHPARRNRVPVDGYGTQPRKTISVADDFFAPARASVSRGTRVRFAWSNANHDSHNVALVKAPRGVKHFASPFATSSGHLTKVLVKDGTYLFVCQVHSNMRTTIRVR